jgi:hypothetical protein
MDYLTVVTAAGKSFFILNDNRGRRQIVRREKIVTYTGSQSPVSQHKRQQFFLSLAGPPPK